MLRDKVCSCDVCGSEIAKGERYVVSKIPKHQIGIVEELMAATEPEMRPHTRAEAERVACA